MEAQRGSNTDSVQTTSNQTNDSLPLTFTSKDMWTKAYTMGHTVACCSFYNGMFSLLCFLGGELGFKARRSNSKVSTSEAKHRQWGDMA